jgi:hypothetical protein
MYLKVRLKYTFLTIFLANGYFSFGQFLHTPEEMEEIVSNNPAKYILQETDNLGSEAFTNCRQPINTPKAKAVATKFILEHKSVSTADKKKLKKRNKKITKLLSKEVDLTLNKELYNNYYKLGNYDQALFYKLQGEDKLTFNFENEYFLAKTYFKTNKPKLALAHVFNAKILMPYSDQGYKIEDEKLLEDLLHQVLKANKKSYQDWGLQFSYCVTNRDNKTYISFKSQPWKTYAICKTVWQEDDQHKTKMATISDQASWLVEEKECLLNALVSYLRHEEHNPEYQGLQQLAMALENNYVGDFIQYEAFAARYLQHPDGQPSREKIKEMMTYFLRVHTANQ